MLNKMANIKLERNSQNGNVDAVDMQADMLINLIFQLELDINVLILMNPSNKENTDPDSIGIIVQRSKPHRMSRNDIGWVCSYKILFLK